MTNGFWKHEKFKDVFIEILRVLVSNDEYIILEVSWWNNSQTGKPFPMEQIQAIEIKKVDIPSWSCVTLDKKGRTLNEKTNPINTIPSNPMPIARD